MRYLLIIFMVISTFAFGDAATIVNPEYIPEVTFGNPTAGVFPAKIDLDGNADFNNVDVYSLTVQGTPILSTVALGDLTDVSEAGSVAGDVLVLQGDTTYLVETLSLLHLSDVTSTTGTGTVIVMSGAPTIADLTNMLHDHTDAANGGTITITNLSDVSAKTGTGTVVMFNISPTIATSGTDEGTLTLEGDLTGEDNGGSIILNMGDDHGTTYESWKIFPQNDDLSIYLTGLGEMLKITPEETYEFGGDDTRNATIMAYGDSTETSGIVRIYNSANNDVNTQYYELAGGIEGNLLLRNETSTAIEIDDTTLDVTIANDCHVLGEIDGDMASLNITGGDLNVGEHLTTRGIIDVYGDAVNDGAYQRMYNAGGEDSTIMYHTIEANGDAFIFGTNITPELMSLTTGISAGDLTVDRVYVRLGVFGDQGVDDGSVYLQGDAASGGGFLRIFNADTEAIGNPAHYNLEANGDNLRIHKQGDALGISIFEFGKDGDFIASGDITGDNLDIANWDTAYSHTSLTNDPHSVTKTQVGLTNVEDTALSTWPGTTSITTIGAANATSLASTGAVTGSNLNVTAWNDHVADVTTNPHVVDVDDITITADDIDKSALGVGEDNYVMAYDHSTTSILWEAQSGSGGSVPVNTTVNSILRGTGASWVEETDFTVDASGNITGGDSLNLSSSTAGVITRYTDDVDADWFIWEFNRGSDYLALDSNDQAEIIKFDKAGPITLASDLEIAGDTIIGTGASTSNLLNVTQSGSTIEVAASIDNTANRFLKMGVYNSDFATFACDNGDGFQWGEIATVDAVFSTIVQSMALDSNGNLDVINDITSYGDQIQVEFAGTSTLSALDSASGVEIIVEAAAEGHIGTATNDELNIQTNNIDAITVDTSQNINVLNNFQASGSIATTNELVNTDTSGTISVDVAGISVVRFTGTGGTAVTVNSFTNPIDGQRVTILCDRAGDVIIDLTTSGRTISLTEGADIIYKNSKWFILS